MYAKSAINTSGTYVASTTVSTTTSPSSVATTLAGVNPVGGAGSSASAAESGGLPIGLEVPSGKLGAFGPGNPRAPVNRPPLSKTGANAGLLVDGGDQPVNCWDTRFSSRAASSDHWVVIGVR